MTDHSFDSLAHHFHGTPVGMGIMQSRVLKFCNHQLADISGYSKKDLPGKHMGLLYPSERESKRMEKYFYPVIEESGMATVETRWRKKRGQIIDVFLVAVTMDPAGSLVKGNPQDGTILLLVFDITNRKSFVSAVRREEITLDVALQKAGNSYWKWNIENGQVEYSAEWIRMLGYKRKDIEPHIRAWQKLIHPDDWHNVRKALNDHLWGESSHYACEYRIQPKAGEWIWVFDYGKVIKEDAQHYPVTFMGTTINIAFLKKIEKELFSREEAESDFHKLDLFAPTKIFKKKSSTGKLIHEFLQILYNPFIAKEETNRFLDRMLHAGNLRNCFLKDLLQYHTAHSNKAGMHQESFNLNMLMREIYEALIPLVRKQEIQLSMQMALRDEESYVYSDSTILHQILLYLLGHKIRSSHAKVLAFGYALTDDKIQFYVKDCKEKKINGRANSKYEPVMADVLIHTSGNSSIQSLTVSKMLANTLDGKIWSQSWNEQDASLFLSIPYVASNDYCNRENGHTDILKEPELESSTMILIVEDDRSNAYFLKEALKSIGLQGKKVQLCFAANGIKAIEICMNNPIDLVLMDIKLPLMDGLSACRKIKSLQPDIPVIAQTAYAYPEDREKIFAAGCNDYLVKPMSIHMIYQKLRKYLPVSKDGTLL